MARDLAQRAAAQKRAAIGGDSTGTDVATTKPATLEQQLTRMTAEYQLAMPKGQEATKLVRDAITCLRTVRNLSEAEPMSVLGALMTCAQLGLRPGVLGHAWPLPFWDSQRRGQVAQLVIGYQGYIELAHRSGRVSGLVARTVYEHDTYEVDYGVQDTLVHRPPRRGRRGAPIAYYALVKYTNGGHAFWDMSQEEMEDWRDQHAPRNRQNKIVGPWVSDFEAMAWKTCVRRLAKWMPKSTELAQAVAADEGVRLDLAPDAEPGTVTEHPPGEIIDGHADDVPPDDAPPPEPPADDGGWPDTAQPGGGRP